MMRISLKIPDELGLLLRRRAKVNTESLNQLIQTLLMKGLSENEILEKEPNVEERYAFSVLKSYCLAQVRVSLGHENDSMVFQLPSGVEVNVMPQAFPHAYQS